MPSQPLVETSWDFGPVLDLIESDSTVVGSPAPLPRKRSLLDTGNDATITLGSFGKLWEKLGISVEKPLPAVSPAKTESAGCQKGQLGSILPKSSIQEVFSKDESIVADAQSPFPSPDNRNATNGTTPTDADSGSSIEETVRGNDPFAGMTKKERHNARKRASKTRKLEKMLQKRQEKKERRQQQVREELKDHLQALQPPAPLPARKSESPEDLPKQTTHSRSNVGAKIRLATPTQGSISALIHGALALPMVAGTEPHTPTPTPLQGHPSEEVLPEALTPGSTSMPLPFYYLSRTGPKPFTPGLATPITTNVGANPVVANPDTSLQSQYTPAPFQYSQPPLGFTTPLDGNANVFVPGSAYGLVPSTIQPVVPRTSRAFKKAAIPSREDKNFEFLTKLIDNFPEDKRWLVSPMRLSSDKMSPGGIHVFVDASNILIGFKDILRKGGRPGFDMSFDCLALLLERRRPVAKRVYAGSTRETAPVASNEKFKELAGAVGYEKNIYEQVFKSKEITERQKFFKDVDRIGWAKATQIHSGNGSGSDSETGAVPSTPPPAPKWVEQGVDEGLHLKMCQSIIDCDIPSTMVLATGDGAGAEYSDGFLAHVERALKKGWKVELVSWKQQLSGSYKNKKFRAKWGDKFKVIALDEYMMYMIDT